MTMAEYKTQNDLSANAKSVSIGILNARLADSIDLALLTKQAHWNIRARNSSRCTR
jgi:starvation-inducible DNA-binding protein